MDPISIKRRELHQRNPDFDVTYLLPLLVAENLIDKHDRAVIKNSSNLTDAANVLFLQVMQVKDKRIQQEFLNILHERRLLDISPIKEFREFLSHLTFTCPFYDIRDLLDLLGAQIIDSYEKSCIKEAGTPVDAATILFLNFMPHKPKRLQLRFVDILRQKNMTQLANHLGPLLDQFYAQQTPAEPSSEPPPQPANRFHQFSSFLSRQLSRFVDIFQTSHMAQAYNIDYKDIIDTLGQVPDFRGQIPISIKKMTRKPKDLKYNRYYDQNGKRLALLINNYTYDDLPNHLYKNREGSLVDYVNMDTLLRALGYEIVGKQDRTAQQMMDDVTEFVARMEEMGEIHSCVVVVMTHGEEGKFIGVDNMSLDHQRFFNAFTENKALAGKPKMLIIEAGRGSKVNVKAIRPWADGTSTGEDSSLMAHDTKDPREDGTSADRLLAPIDKEEATNMTKIATDADTWIMYSTTPGYVSWGNKAMGSWFLQALCQEVAANVHQPWADLLTLSYRVRNRLAEQIQTVPVRNGEGEDGEPRYDYHDVVQVPVMETNMTKKFHFFFGKG